MTDACVTRARAGGCKSFNYRRGLNKGILTAAMSALCYGSSSWFMNKLISSLMCFLVETFADSSTFRSDEYLGYQDIVIETLKILYSDK